MRRIPRIKEGNKDRQSFSFIIEVTSSRRYIGPVYKESIQNTSIPATECFVENKKKRVVYIRWSLAQFSHIVGEALSGNFHDSL